MPDFLNISQVLSYLDLKSTFTAAEFGCGTADFALALAKKLDKGKVYAMDIQREKLSVLEQKMASQNIGNIKIVVCDLEEVGGSTLKDNFLDVVLIPNLLFQAENAYAIINEAVRVLKPGGQCLIIDWLKPVSFGPKEGLIKPEELKKNLVKLKLLPKKEFMAGDYHFALIFTKQS